MNDDSMTAEEWFAYLRTDPHHKDGGICIKCDKPVIYGEEDPRDSAEICLRTKPFCLNHDHMVDWRARCLAAERALAAVQVDANVVLEQRRQAERERDEARQQLANVNASLCHALRMQDKYKEESEELTRLYHDTDNALQLAVKEKLDALERLAISWKKQ